jgi:WD40 repeat protein
MPSETVPVPGTTEARTPGMTALQPHFSEVKAARFSPDGERLVTASDDARARLWQVRSFDSFPELLAFAKPHAAETATSRWSTW